MHTVTKEDIRRNRILHDDCLHVMSLMPSNSIDFILTDPPYLVNYRSRDGRSIANDVNPAWVKPAYAEMYRVLKPDSFCVSFYGWQQADIFVAAFKEAGFRVLGHFTFPKRYTSSVGYLRAQHENAYLLGKGEPEIPAYVIGDVIEFVYSGNKLHPTQKPISALLPVIDTFCKPGKLVFDPFAGSGSILEAAWRSGRCYLGVELDPKYHAIATERLQAMRSQPPSTNAS